MISIRLSEMFGLRHPIVLGPMGGVSGGRLAAAVSNAGGLGLIGAGYGDEAWLRPELTLTRAAVKAPWGVGFITRSAQRSAARSKERAAYRDSTRAGDFDTAVVWAGEAVDHNRRVERASVLVRTRFFRARSRVRAALSREVDFGFEDVFAFAGARCDRMVANVPGRLQSRRSWCS